MSNMTKETSLFDSHVSKKQLITKVIRVERHEFLCSIKSLEPDHDIYLKMLHNARLGNVFVDNDCLIKCLKLFLRRRDLIHYVWISDKLDFSNSEQGFISMLKAGVFDKMTCNEFRSWPFEAFFVHIFEEFEHNEEIFPKRQALLCNEHFLLYFYCISESLSKKGYTYRAKKISCSDNKFLLDSISKLCQKSKKQDSKKVVRSSEICDKLVKPIKTTFPIGKFINLSKFIKMKSFQKTAFDTNQGKQLICKKNELSQLISDTSKLQDKCVDSDLERKKSTLADNDPDAALNLLTRYKMNTCGVLKDIMASNSPLKLKYLEVNDIKPKFNDSVFSIYLFELGVKCAGPLNSKLKKIVFDMPNFLQVSASKIPAIETWPKKSDECKNDELMPYFSTPSMLQDEYLNSDLHAEKPELIEQKNFNASLKKSTKNEPNIYWIGKCGICTKNSDDQERLTIKEIQLDFNYSLFKSYWIGEILFPTTVERKNHEVISLASPILTLQCKELMPNTSTLSTLQDEYFNSDLHTQKPALTEEKNLSKNLKKLTENEPSIFYIGKDGTCTKNSDDQERLTIKEIQPDFNYSRFKSYWTGGIVFPKMIERKSRKVVPPSSPILTLKAKCLEFILEYEKSVSLNENPNIGWNYFAWNELSIQKVVEDSSCTINFNSVNGEQLIHELNNSDFTNQLLLQDEILPMKPEVPLVKNPDIPLSLLSDEDKIIGPSSKDSSPGKLSLKSNCLEIKQSYDSKIDSSPDFQYACECSLCPFESFCDYCETFVRHCLNGLFSVEEEQPIETSFHGIACATCFQRDGKLYFECGHYSCFQCFSSKFKNCCKPLDTTVCTKCESEFSKCVPNYLYGMEECVQNTVLHDWYDKTWTLKQNDTEIQMPSSSFSNCNYISVC